MMFFIRFCILLCYLNLIDFILKEFNNGFMLSMPIFTFYYLEGTTLYIQIYVKGIKSNIDQSYQQPQNSRIKLISIRKLIFYTKFKKVEELGLKNSIPLCKISQ